MLANGCVSSTRHDHETARAPVVHEKGLEGAEQAEPEPSGRSVLRIMLRFLTGTRLLKLVYIV